jgi:hypothetical protein
MQNRPAARLRPPLIGFDEVSAAIPSGYPTGTDSTTMRHPQMAILYLQEPPIYGLKAKWQTTHLPPRRPTHSRGRQREWAPKSASSASAADRRHTALIREPFFNHNKLIHCPTPMQTIYKFLDNQLSLSNFESWLYNNEHAEELLGAALYTDLICLDYTQRDAANSVRKKLSAAIDNQIFGEWVLRQNLAAIVSANKAGLEALCWSYYAHHDGYLFLDNLAFGWGAHAIDRLTYGHAWPGAAPTSTLVETLVLPARQEALRVLRWLNLGLITVGGEPWTYMDNRPMDERTPRTYTLIKLDSSGAILPKQENHTPLAKLDSDPNGES